MSTNSAFECKTLYQAVASTGYQIVFQRGKFFVSLLSRGGTIWVNPHGPSDVSGTIPTTPIPSAGVIADGWLRIGASESATLGTDPSSTAGETATPAGQSIAAVQVEQIAFLDVWCEVQGDLVVIAH